MSEAELLMLQVEILNHLWTVFFTWIGSTTGMVAAAYFAAERFRVSLIAGMLGLYTLFTSACVAQLARSWKRTKAIGEDLLGLQDSGLQLSQSSRVLLENIESELIKTAVWPTIATIFLLSFAYVILCYRESKK